MVELFNYLTTAILVFALLLRSSVRLGNTALALWVQANEQGRGDKEYFAEILQNGRGGGGDSY